MSKNERGENNPVYMQKDRKQENAKRRGWHDYPTTCLQVAPKPAANSSYSSPIPPRHQRMTLQTLDIEKAGSISSLLRTT